MAAVGDLAGVQVELAGVAHVLRRVGTGLLGEAVGQLRADGSGQGAGLAGVVERLTGDVDGGGGAACWRALAMSCLTSL